MTVENIPKTINQLIPSRCCTRNHLEYKSLLTLDIQSEIGSLADMVLSYYFKKFHDTVGKVELDIKSYSAEDEKNTT